MYYYIIFTIMVLSQSVRGDFFLHEKGISDLSLGVILSDEYFQRAENLKNDFIGNHNSRFFLTTNLNNELYKIDSIKIGGIPYHSNLFIRTDETKRIVELSIKYGLVEGDVINEFLFNALGNNTIETESEMNGIVYKTSKVWFKESWSIFFTNNSEHFEITYLLDKN